MTNSELAELLAAVSPGPWNFDPVKRHKLRSQGDGPSVAYIHPGTGSRNEDAERELLALAPALAQEVLDLREAGAALLKALRRHRCDRSCFYAEEKRICGRVTALVRWAELPEAVEKVH